MSTDDPNQQSPDPVAMYIADLMLFTSDSLSTSFGIAREEVLNTLLISVLSLGEELADTTRLTEEPLKSMVEAMKDDQPVTEK